MSNLNDLRNSLDTIDRSLVQLLAERFKVTESVGQYKKAHGLPAVDEAREAEQFSRIEALAKEADLNPDFAKKLLRLIIDEVVQNHEEIIGADA